MSRWFRLYDDTLNDPKVLKLSDKTYRIWIGILCIASKNNGELPPFDDMAILLRLKPKNFQPELEKLIEAGLLDHDDDGLRPHNWAARQYKSDVSTERVKRFRNASRNVSETPPDTDTDTDTEKKDIRAVAHATRPASNEEFLEFWKVYPRRQGANPKHPARKKFEAQVKSGVSPETIIAAARAYEAEQRKLGHVGTPYIAQAVTWLNQQRFDDYQSQTSGTGPPAGLTAEQQAKWVRDQMEAEREKNSNGVEQIGLVLGRGEKICGAPPEGERSAGMVRDYPRNAEAH